MGEEGDFQVSQGIFVVILGCFDFDTWILFVNRDIDFCTAWFECKCWWFGGRKYQSNKMHSDLMWVFAYGGIFCYLCFGMICFILLLTHAFCAKFYR